MKAKKRFYLLVLTCCAFLFLVHFGGHRLKSLLFESRMSSSELAASSMKSPSSVASFHKRSKWSALIRKTNTTQYQELLDNSHTASVSDDNHDIFYSDEDNEIVNGQFSDDGSNADTKRSCTMESCFDFSLCWGRPFKVYVYPAAPSVLHSDDPKDRSAASPSPDYVKVLDAIRRSPLYTSDPSKACLFVLAFDTLDRDRNSKNFVRNLQAKVQRLPSWREGRNHVVFNLFSGTYPDYSETDLGFDYGQAILAKASMSEGIYRPHFDVSMPLFHPSHPERGGAPGYASTYQFPVSSSKKHFLAFKGKRYLYGIGSETRNSLHHLHNGKDVVAATTCKHGKNWKEFKDDRCDEDNKEYDRWDYDDLLRNSTFCLVPRGRRLGSFRFIETLQAGCVPVLLSNGWKLPFAEVIDWSQAVFQADERLLMQVPEMLRSVSQAKIFEMRQQTQLLWDQYLSSVEKIVLTTLEIIKERIYQGTCVREGVHWNSHPGALFLQSSATAVTNFPFPGPGSPTLNNHPASTTGPLIRDTHFTAVIFTTTTPQLLSSGSSTGTGSSSSYIHHNNPIFKLVASVAASQYVDKILVYWTLPVGPPPIGQWPILARRRKLPPIEIVILSDNEDGAGEDGGRTSKKTVANQSSTSFFDEDERFREKASSMDKSNMSGVKLSRRFSQHPSIKTSAVLSLDDDTSVTTEEIDFAFSVWRHFPERIVGFPARTHFWDSKKKRWSYTSKWSNEYSMVLTGVAFYHRYYNYLYTEWLAPETRHLVDQLGNCDDILMNFLVSHVTKRPPIKVTQRKHYKDKTTLPGSKSPWSSPDHFAQRQTCMAAFAASFGYMPLKKSMSRFDPILYKDPVSTVRKKYPKMESIQIISGASNNN